MKTEYTIKELSDRLNVSTRTVERYLKNLYTKEKNRVMVPLDVVELLEVRHNSDNENEGGIETIEQTFSVGQYDELQRIIIEHPALQERIEYLLKDVEYHKQAVVKVREQMDSLIHTVKAKEIKELHQSGVQWIPEPPNK